MHFILEKTSKKLKIPDPAGELTAPPPPDPLAGFKAVSP